MHADAGGSAGWAIQNIRDFNAMMQPLCQAVSNDGDASPHSNDPTLSLITITRPITRVASPRFCRSVIHARPTVGISSIRSATQAFISNLLVQFVSADRLFDINNIEMPQPDGYS